MLPTIPRFMDALRKSLRMTDKSGKDIELVDYVAETGVGVEIGHQGHKLWVCIDGVAVLRVKAPEIFLTDMREESAEGKSLA
jgi:hypothetical protein